MNNSFVRWLLDLDHIPETAERLRVVWERPWPLWAWVLAAAAVGVFGAWSYSRLAGGRPARATLATIRAMAVMLVLVFFGRIGVSLFVQTGASRHVTREQVTESSQIQPVGLRRLFCGTSMLEESTTRFSTPSATRKR